MAPPSKQSSSRDLRHRVLTCLTRLSDRDTQSLAITELESIIPTLTPSTYSLFISSVSSTSTADRSAVRVASLRLLSSLAASHGTLLTPHLSRLVSSLVRRLRDSDSAVRSACSATSSSFAAHIASTPASLAAILRPLSEALATEQEASAQSASAMCLSAAIEAAATSVEPGQIVAKMVPKWMKLLKSDSFKAKSSVLVLIRSVIRVCEAGGGGGGDSSREMVCVCVELLKSEDWVTRKGAVEVLTELAASVDNREMLSEIKASCLKTFEARRFDKVKAVREAMNLMLEAWKEIPDVFEDESSPPPRSQASSTKENNNASVGRHPPRSTGSRISNSPHSNTKRIIRSSPPSNGVLKTTARSKTPIGDSRRRSGPPAIRKLDFNSKPSGRKPAIPGLCGSAVAPIENESQLTYEELEHTRRSSIVQEQRRIKTGLGLNRVLQFSDVNDDQTDPAVGVTDQCTHDHKECEDFSSIRKQLAQIETQQSSLMELLQKFIKSSQDGMHTLESRVNGIELALDDMSYDMAVSTTRIAKSEAKKPSCCMLPGSDFLSPKFWRRSEARGPATRFSLPSNANRPVSDNAPFKIPSTSSAPDNTFKLQNRKRFSSNIGAGGVIINPLAAESTCVPPTSRGI